MVSGGGSALTYLQTYRQAQMNKAQKAEFNQRADLALNNWDICFNDYDALCRIERVLQCWSERECNGEIERDEETNICYQMYPQSGRRLCKIADRETGALRRAKTIADKYGLKVYHQTDPRGVQLYLYRPEDSENIDSIYNMRGLACY